MFTRRKSFFDHLAQTSQFPPAIELLKAEGCYVYDAGGKKYLDLISGISVSSLGHGNDEIKRAIKEQLEKHLHLMVYGEHIITPQVELASALSEHLPPSLQSIFFTNSGAEATEGAMKLAKRYTGRTRFVSFRNSYHGSTQGALSICGNEILKNAFRPLLPDHLVLDFNDSESLNKIDKQTAAVFVEPIQGEAGIVMPDKNFMRELRRRCREVNALLVFDEIQTGMGRTGSLFAFSDLDVVPDVLLLGKAFGGGMPLGAFISSVEIMSTLSHDPALGHLTTFGGHPLSCAAALASLNILTKTELVKNVFAKEDLFRKLIVHPSIKSIRGKGLLLAVEFENEIINQKVIHGCAGMGILTDWFLFAPDCMRIAPPLIISDDEIAQACKVIVDAIRKNSIG